MILIAHPNPDNSLDLPQPYTGQFTPTHSLHSSFLSPAQLNSLPHTHLARLPSPLHRETRPTYTYPSPSSLIPAGEDSLILLHPCTGQLTHTYPHSSPLTPAQGDSLILPHPCRRHLSLPHPCTGRLTQTHLIHPPSALHRVVHSSPLIPVQRDSLIHTHLVNLILAGDVSLIFLHPCTGQFTHPSHSPPLTPAQGNSPILPHFCRRHLTRSPSLLHGEAYSKTSHSSSLTPAQGSSLVLLHPCTGGSLIFSHLYAEPLLWTPCFQGILSSRVCLLLPDGSLRSLPCTLNLTLTLCPCLASKEQEQEPSKPRRRAAT